MAEKEKIGLVISDKMKNTRIVTVNDRIIHKRYKKVVTRTKRYAVHDSTFESSIGDQVRIQEVKPLSKTKNWILVGILRKSIT
jgi:small subunit ribosomal protein S17